MKISGFVKGILLAVCVVIALLCSSLRSGPGQYAVYSPDSQPGVYAEARVLDLVPFAMDQDTSDFYCTVTLSGRKTGVIKVSGNADPADVPVSGSTLIFRGKTTKMPYFGGRDAMLLSGSFDSVNREFRDVTLLDTTVLDDMYTICSSLMYGALAVAAIIIFSSLMGAVKKRKKLQEAK